MDKIKPARLAALTEQAIGTLLALTGVWGLFGPNVAMLVGGSLLLGYGSLQEAGRV